MCVSIALIKREITSYMTGTILHRLQHAGYVTCGRYNPRHPNICVTGSNNQILVWDLRSSSRPSQTLEYKDKFGQVIQSDSYLYAHRKLFKIMDK